PPATRLAALARRLLEASTLCAIATVSPGRRAHINTAYFAWSEVRDRLVVRTAGAALAQRARERVGRDRRVPLDADLGRSRPRHSVLRSCARAAWPRFA